MFQINVDFQLSFSSRYPGLLAKLLHVSPQASFNSSITGRTTLSSWGRKVNGHRVPSCPCLLVLSRLFLRSMRTALHSLPLSSPPKLVLDWYPVDQKQTKNIENDLWSTEVIILNLKMTWSRPVGSNPIIKINPSHELCHVSQTVVMDSQQPHTFLVDLLSDLILLQIPLCIPHPVNYCSLLSSRPPPPFHGVTVDTWHLETTCSSPYQVLH